MSSLMVLLNSETCIIKGLIIEMKMVNINIPKPVINAFSNRFVILPITKL